MALTTKDGIASVKDPAPGYEGRTGEGYEEGGGMRTKLCIFGVDVAKKKEYNPEFAT